MRIRGTLTRTNVRDYILDASGPCLVGSSGQAGFATFGLALAIVVALALVGLCATPEELSKLDLVGYKRDINLNGRHERRRRQETRHLAANHVGESSNVMDVGIGVFVNDAPYDNWRYARRPLRAFENSARDISFPSKEHVVPLILLAREERFSENRRGRQSQLRLSIERQIGAVVSSCKYDRRAHLNLVRYGVSYVLKPKTKSEPEVAIDKTKFVSDHDLDGYPSSLHYLNQIPSSNGALLGGTGQVVRVSAGRFHLGELPAHQHGLPTHELGLPIHSAPLTIGEDGESAAKESQQDGVDYSGDRSNDFPPIGRRTVLCRMVFLYLSAIGLIPCCYYGTRLRERGRRAAGGLLIYVGFATYFAGLILLALSLFSWSWGWWL